MTQFYLHPILQVNDIGSNGSFAFGRIAGAHHSVHLVLRGQCKVDEAKQRKSKCAFSYQHRVLQVIAHVGVKGVFLYFAHVLGRFGSITRIAVTGCIWFRCGWHYFDCS